MAYDLSLGDGRSQFDGSVTLIGMTIASGVSFACGLFACCSRPWPLDMEIFIMQDESLKAIVFVTRDPRKSNITCSHVHIYIYIYRKIFD